LTRLADLTSNIFCMLKTLIFAAARDWPAVMWHFCQAQQFCIMAAHPKSAAKS